MIIIIDSINVETGFVYQKRFNNISNALAFYNSLDCPKGVEFNTGNAYRDIVYKREFYKITS